MPPFPHGGKGIRLAQHHGIGILGGGNRGFLILYKWSGDFVEINGLIYLQKMRVCGN